MEYDPKMDSENEPQGRRERKKERTRGEIFTAAMALFAQRDFDSVTISAICERADVGRGTFFLHFPTKSALLYEFSRGVADAFLAGLSEPRGSARSELEAFVDLIGAELNAQPDVMLAMLREFSTSREALSYGREHGWVFPELIAEIVERGQKLGEFSDRVDARLVAASLLSTAGAILGGWVFRPGEHTSEAVREQFFSLVFDGLAPSNAEARS